MHLPMLLQFVLWSSFALSLVALALLLYGIFRLVDDGDDEWPVLTSFVVGELVIMALMTCSLALLGYSTQALWVWRVFSGIVSAQNVIFSIPVLLRNIRDARRRQGGSFVGGFFVIAATIVPILFFVCSIEVQSLPYASTSSSVQAAAAILTQLNFWHTALYAVLVLASIICSVLFIVSTRRDGPLSFERRGGGLGAGSGGWEISNSLTYLIATITLGALLLALISHSDALDQEREKRQEDAAHKVSPALNIPNPSTPAAQKTEADKIAPGAAHPAGAETNGH